MCSSCYEDYQKEQNEKAKKAKQKALLVPQVRRKKIEWNIIAYLFYCTEHLEVESMNKRHFERIGVPMSSVNYLVKLLKQRGFLSTVGKVGKQRYVPTHKVIKNVLVQKYRIAETLATNEKYIPYIVILKREGNDRFTLPTKEPFSHKQKKGKRKKLLKLSDIQRQEEKERFWKNGRPKKKSKPYHRTSGRPKNTTKKGSKEPSKED